EREGEDVVKTEHMKKAQNKIELDSVGEVIKTLPVQSKLVLASIVFNGETGRGALTTGELYDIYKDVVRKTGMNIVTQRRATDLISELDMLGIINARVISYGRGGRTREITPAVPIQDTKELLLQDETLNSLKDYKIQTRRKYF
ncbi:MAG: cell division control protein Cdc6, partial [Nanoarchaeota archaeon]|nr:cell division control protein Cdc6 [Nanoarchaeota archaeon]